MIDLMEEAFDLDLGPLVISDSTVEETVYFGTGVDVTLFDRETIDDFPGEGMRNPEALHILVGEKRRHARYRLPAYPWRDPDIYDKMSFFVKRISAEVFLEIANDAPEWIFCSLALMVARGGECLRPIACIFSGWVDVDTQYDQAGTIVRRTAYIATTPRRVNIENGHLNSASYTSGETICVSVVVPFYWRPGTRLFYDPMISTGSYMKLTCDIEWDISHFDEGSWEQAHPY